MSKCNQIYWTSLIFPSETAYSIKFFSLEYTAIFEWLSREKDGLDKSFIGEATFNYKGKAFPLE